MVGPGPRSFYLKTETARFVDSDFEQLDRGGRVGPGRILSPRARIRSIRKFLSWYHVDRHLTVQKDYFLSGFAKQFRRKKRKWQ